MKNRVSEVRHVRDYVLFVAFADGASGEIDLASELDGEVFLPLRELSLFCQAHVEPEMHTIVWPNGADLDPEFVRAHLSVSA